MRIPFLLRLWFIFGETSHAGTVKPIHFERTAIARIGQGKCRQETAIFADETVPSVRYAVEEGTSAHCPDETAYISA